MNIKQISLPDLRNIIDDVLIILEIDIAIRPVSRSHTHIRNLHPLQVLIHNTRILPSTGYTNTLPKCGNTARRNRMLPGHIVAVGKFEHGIAQLGVTQQQKTHVGAVVGAAVVGGFTGHVGEVDALAEHVAVDGRFGGCDAEALAEDTAEVGAAGAVPEEAAVAVLEVGEGGFCEAVCFAFALDAEDIDDLGLLVWGLRERDRGTYLVREMVGCAARVVQIVGELGELG